MKRRKRKQKTPEQMRRRSHRRERLFRLFGRLLFIGVLLAAAVLALTVFFKVDTISIEGSIKYSAEEIVAGMDVKKGDNLYLWNKVKTRDVLLERFPYLQTVQIRRRLPDTIVVTVTESEAVLAVPSDGGYYLVSEQGKILEQTDSDRGLSVATGVSLMGMQPGQMIEQSSDAYTDALLAVLMTLDAADMLEDTDFINLQSLTDVRIGYQKRFDIRVGTVEDLAYRLRFAQTVIENRLSPSDIGRLYWDAKARLHYVPDTAENVAKSRTGVDDSDVVTFHPDGTAIPEDGQSAPEDSSEPEDETEGEEGEESAA
ncbi:MAG: cell division protein FtsQ/DivIB [Agathobaculum sp.]|jgi:hypothetical protein|uniref:cell division protein FtsQ/DivIB n=1 Tax=Agathobaculum sp. TaxID=2048138 RepID=UPI003D8A2200